METPKYERQRNARIVCNKEKLRSLGLGCSPEPASQYKFAPARKRVRQPKPVQPIRHVPSRNCISKHTHLSQAALAPVFLSEREPENVLASRFKFSMGKRKSLATVHWADSFAPSDECEADATELYHAFLPDVKKEEKAQQAACLLANNDLARGDIVSATEDDSIERLDELLEYMKPTSGMRLRLTCAWKRMRSGMSEFATHADECTFLYSNVSDMRRTKSVGISMFAGSSRSSTRAHTAAQSEVLRLSREFVDNRIIPEGSDSIDSFAEMYEKVRCALHGHIVCTCCRPIIA